MLGDRHTSTRPILLLGASGQLGRVLGAGLGTLGPVTMPGTPGGAPRIDLRSHGALRRVVRSLNPSLIVNAAAYTDVDGAEDEPDVAAAINHRAPEILAQEATRAGIGLLHFSSDYVFDGRRAGAYREEDDPNPLGVYGSTKLEGERAVMRECPAALVLRTSWVYGDHGRNFLRTITRRMAQGHDVRVVDDQRGTPTWSVELGGVATDMLARIGGGAVPAGSEVAAHAGLYHVASSGEATWYEFACAIRDACGYDVRVDPIATEDWPTRAVRPRQSALRSDRLFEEFGTRLSHWRLALARCVASSPVLARGHESLHPRAAV